MFKIIVYNGNYADEFDVQAYKIFSDEEWEAFHARDYRLQVLNDLKDSNFEITSLATG